MKHCTCSFWNVLSCDCGRMPREPTSCPGLKLIAVKTLRVTQATKNNAAWREHELSLLPVPSLDHCGQLVSVRSCTLTKEHWINEVIVSFSKQRLRSLQNKKGGVFLEKTSWYESSKKVVRCDLCVKAEQCGGGAASRITSELWYLTSSLCWGIIALCNYSCRRRCRECNTK